ncbi:MAG: hypothetical protein KC620_17025 [Myxococcales bacterium]|nr:hypothetical protein [Myxococcales bacterium]
MGMSHLERNEWVRHTARMNEQIGQAQGSATVSGPDLAAMAARRRG